ncbi:glycosyl hydrolase [Steroidobacter cummioxidans]|uniref:glycosyl hydrolase n=1 Tax=Steroidobacter cummioxidans TaxID=1803913 RepID=UPI000E31A11E|nr:glycosyl hydrolase [Steroidobacter cummioxidans]
MKRITILLIALFCNVCFAQERDDSVLLWQRFQQPPDAARPMMRWWWFGPAVTHVELDRQIAAMKAGGFGGFEVQPVYALSTDDPSSGIVNTPYLSDPFLAALRHTSETARASGMRMDVTLGSGWPFGGPHVPITQAAAEIRRVEITIPASASSITLPVMEPGERAVALFLNDARLPLVNGPALDVRPVQQERKACLFVAGRTGQQVKRAAVGAEGFVIDHISSGAVANHLAAVGDRLLSAFDGATKPYAMFSDSLESYGASWTDDLPQEFERRRGYDLLDHLPALFAEGSSGAAVRFDWARTLSELVDERYLKPINAWANQRGTRFRAQVYGLPPPTLSSNALVDLPEGEGADWRRFNSTRWASSAAHIYGRSVVSSETWTWLHSPSWAATPLDLKVEADRHFLQGVNQIIGHGWPYSPPQVAEPGWAFYAAAALNDHNPWYPVMPTVTRYLQRVSAMLREGRPDSAVAIYLPTEDAFADMRPAHASVNEGMRQRFEPNTVGQVLDAGQTFDFIDASAILAGKLTHRLLILPGLTRIDPAAFERIAAWVDNGGWVIATGALPNNAGGLMDGTAGAQKIQQLARRLLEAESKQRVHVVAPESLGATLRSVLEPTVALAASDAAFGFIRRRLENGSLYFIANTGPRPIETRARFAGDNGRGEWWDPVTAERRAAGAGDIAVQLAPYESKLLVFVSGLDQAEPATVHRVAPVLDLSKAWRVQAKGASATPPQPGSSWTDEPKLQHYSGSVTYQRSFVLGKAALTSEARLFLDFGDGTALPDVRQDRPRALLEAPIRDAALVRVNGKDAGAVWMPPWRLDVTSLLRPGKNEIEVVVMNTAINALSARPVSKRLLELRYGPRFREEDQDKIQPAPSGLLRPVKLVRSTSYPVD